MAILDVYRDTSTMEPLLPENIGDLEPLATILLEKACALSASIHPETSKAIATFLRPMNSCVHSQGQVEGALYETKLVFRMDHASTYLL